MFRRLTLLLATLAVVALIAAPSVVRADGCIDCPIGTTTVVHPTPATPTPTPPAANLISGSLAGDGPPAKYDLTRSTGKGTQLTLTQTNGCWSVPGDTGPNNDLGFFVWYPDRPEPDRSTAHPTRHCTSHVSVPVGTGDVTVQVYNNVKGQTATFTLEASDTAATLGSQAAHASMAR